MEIIFLLSTLEPISSWFFWKHYFCNYFSSTLFCSIDFLSFHWFISSIKKQKNNPKEQNPPCLRSTIFNVQSFPLIIYSPPAIIPLFIHSSQFICQKIWLNAHSQILHFLLSFQLIPFSSLHKIISDQYHEGLPHCQDNGHLTIPVFLDLSASFDIVCQLLPPPSWLLPPA